MCVCVLVCVLVCVDFYTASLTALCQIDEDTCTYLMSSSSMFGVAISFDSLVDSLSFSF